MAASRTLEEEHREEGHRILEVEELHSLGEGHHSLGVDHNLEVERHILVGQQEFTGIDKDYHPLAKLEPGC